MNQQFYQVGGSLPANSKSYIKREADDKLYNYLKEGKYCYVLNARQVGKSSLRVHTSKRLKEDGYSCVNIDLTSIGSEDITADEWYFSFLLYIVEELGLDEDEFVEWWDDNDKLTVVNRFAKTFDKFILKIIDKKIVIFIDEVDSILGIKKDFSADDFFAVIRTFYNLRSEDERYNRVTFALFGVATPEDLMRDSTRTPFNIAHSIKITQFKLEESLSLVDGLDNQTVDSHKILEKIFEWTSGTPYLTQKILNYISSNPIKHIADIDKVVDTLFIQENFNEINISNIQKRIVSSEQYSVKMLYLIGELIGEGKIRADDGKFEQIYLKLSGLVKETNGELFYTNKIYKQIFNQDWLEEALGKIDRPFAKDLQRWIELNKAQSALLKGEVLKNAIDWALKRDDLTSSENEYLRLSFQQEQEYILKEEKKKGQSRTIQSLSVFSFLLVLISVGLAYYYLQSKKLEDNAQNQLKRIQQFVYSDYCYKGVNYFNKKKYDKAIESYKKAIDIDDKKEEAYIQLAKIYSKKKKYNKVVETYKKLIEINKNNEKALNSLGYTYLLLDDYNNSLDVLNKAIKIDSNYYYAYNNRGLVHMKLHQYKIAMSEFQESIKINPKYSKPYSNIGDIYYDKKEYDKAIEWYKKALKNKKSYWTYYKIGASYSKKKKYDTALNAYKEAIKFDFDKKEEAYCDMGIANFELEKYIEAKDFFKKAISINSNIEIYDYDYKMGIIYSHLQEFKKAEESYLKAIIVHPDNEIGFFKNGNIYFKLKKYKQSLESYLKVLEINSQNYKALVKIGIVYNELGKKSKKYGKQLSLYNKALDYFDKALEININDDIYYNKGNTYYRKREYNKAIEQYNKAIELNPYNDKALNDKALSYLNQNNYVKAIDTYKKVAEINPKHYKAFNSMGVAYLKLARVNDKEKNNKNAIESFRKSIEINPEHYKAYIGIFDFQLFNKEPFSWDLKNDYEKIFKKQKEILILYEMRKILKEISNGYSANESINNWKNKYGNVQLSVNLKIFFKWARNHKTQKTKRRLLHALNVFLEHKKKVK